MKAKIFGLSSANIYGINPGEFVALEQTDALGRARTDYRQQADPSFKTYGPQTRREFLALARSGH